MKQVSRKGFCAKISLGAKLGSLNTEFGFMSNENDAFVLNGAMAHKYEVMFKAPGKIQAVPFQPGVGSKFYGNYRDKGSISALIENVDICAKFDYEGTELEYFLEFVKSIGNHYYLIDNSIYVSIDIVANPSTGRDNVNALLLDSALNYKSILKNEDIELSFEQASKIDIRELCKKIDMNKEVVLIKNNEIIYSFGKTAVLIENFFWQPTHDQRLHNKVKEDISLNYNQAVDGFQVFIPTLYESIIGSLDFKSIKESMLMIGVELKSHEDSVQHARVLGSGFASTELDELEGLL